MLGLLAKPEVRDRLDNLESKHEISLDNENSVVRIRTALQGRQEGEEATFVIDVDFYNTQKTEIEAIWEKLEYFHQEASRLIRWCITDRLHNIMEPREL